MLIATLQTITGRTVAWTKYNLATGMYEELTGTLISAGISKNIGNVEYAIIEEPGGRQWITLASCVKGVAEKS